VKQTANHLFSPKRGVAVNLPLKRLKIPEEFRKNWICIIGHPRVRRAAIDQTGIGAALVERLQVKFGGKVEGISFTNATKEAMSVTVRRRFEQRLNLIPNHHREIERDLAAIKRMATPYGNLRFDAERLENSHADIYWAKALADVAAEQPRSSLARDGFMVSRPRHPDMMPWPRKNIF
jgi:phage FluMu gp28-like protein